MNYFSSQAVASGYANHRPYFHPLVVDKISEHLQLETKMARVLDVGCGAGLSTIALLPLADEVVGIDSSPAMVEAAIPHEHIQYLSVPAEELPFPSASFQLITVCGALNWINRSRFFPAARRALCSKGWIIIYDNIFQGAMQGQSDFGEWYTKEFLLRYPKPSRDERPISVEECSEYGFRFPSSETYTNEITYSLEQFIDYLLTQSNITVPLAQGMENETAVRGWFRGSLTSFFKDEPKILAYGGFIWYLQCL